MDTCSIEMNTKSRDIKMLQAETLAFLIKENYSLSEDEKKSKSLIEVNQKLNAMADKNLSLT